MRILEFIADLAKWTARQGVPCLFWLTTGLYCPACGGTRALRALLRGDLRMSFQYHPLVLYMAAVFAVELAGYCLSKVTKNPRWYLGHETLFIYIGIGIIFVNWIFKNYMLLHGVDLLPLWPYWE